MEPSTAFALDIVAITIMTFGLYFPRHRRRDLVVAYLGVNIGVLAVAHALASTNVGAGIGLGIFGVLSIIRLRSNELDQQEIAYYFAALALGLVGGLTVTPAWITPALMVALLIALYVGDHPRLFGQYRSHTLTLGTAYTDEAEVTRTLTAMLGATIHRVAIRKVDLVNDSTVVDVRYVVPAAEEDTSHRDGSPAHRPTDVGGAQE